MPNTFLHCHFSVAVHSSEAEHHSTQTATDIINTMPKQPLYKEDKPTVVSKETMVYPLAKSHVTTNTSRLGSKEVSTATKPLKDDRPTQTANAFAEANFKLLWSQHPSKHKAETQTFSPHMVDRETSQAIDTSNENRVMVFIKDAFNKAMTSAKTVMVDNSTMVKTEVSNQATSVDFSEFNPRKAVSDMKSDRSVELEMAQPGVTPLPRPPVIKVFDDKDVQTEPVNYPNHPTTKPSEAMDISMAWDIIETTENVVKLKEARSVVQPPTLEPIKEENEPEESSQSNSNSVECDAVITKPERAFEPHGSKSGQALRHFNGLPDVLARSKSEGNLKSITLSYAGKEELKPSNHVKVFSSESKSILSDFPTVKSDDFTILHQPDILQAPVVINMESNYLAHSNPPSRVKLSLTHDGGDISSNKLPDQSISSIDISSSGDQAILNHHLDMSGSDSITLRDGTLSSLSSQFNISDLTDADADTLSLSEFLAMENILSQP